MKKTIKVKVPVDIVLEEGIQEDTYRVEAYAFGNQIANIDNYEGSEDDAIRAITDKVNAAIQTT